MKFLRQTRRKWMRERLEDAYYDGCRIAHLPAFLDRAPRHDLHRAIRSAFMRGFIAEQAEIRKPIPFTIPAFGPHMDEPNSEWDG